MIYIFSMLNIKKKKELLEVTTRSTSDQFKLDAFKSTYE
jgi:hypothetical protein